VQEFVIVFWTPPEGPFENRFRIRHLFCRCLSRQAIWLG
jgi:hypothetical protein